MTNQIIFNIDPVAAPRMTQSDKWSGRPAAVKYYAFRDELKLQANKAGFTLGETIRAVFIVPMPKSWSKKKRTEMYGEPHKQTPDTDNFMKALKDSLAPRDEYVWHEEATKIWGDRGAIYLQNLDLSLRDIVKQISSEFNQPNDTQSA